MGPRHTGFTGDADGVASSLEKATKSPAACGRVRATVYPGAGEVVLSKLDGRRSSHGELPSGDQTCRRGDLNPHALVGTSPSS